MEFTQFRILVEISRFVLPSTSLINSITLMEYTRTIILVEILTFCPAFGLHCQFYNSAKFTLVRIWEHYGWWTVVVPYYIHNISICVWLTVAYSRNFEGQPSAKRTSVYISIPLLYYVYTL